MNKLIIIEDRRVSARIPEEQTIYIDSLSSLFFWWLVGPVILMVIALRDCIKEDT